MMMTLLASYIYFADIKPGGVATTVDFQRLDIELDKNRQITAVKLFESDKLGLKGKLNHVLQHPQATHDPDTGCIRVDFAGTPSANVVQWEAIIDLDDSDQILGIEVLFANQDLMDKDVQTSFSAKGKLDHLAKFMT